MVRDRWPPVHVALETTRGPLEKENSPNQGPETRAMGCKRHPKQVTMTLTCSHGSKLTQHAPQRKPTHQKVGRFGQVRTSPVEPPRGWGTHSGASKLRPSSGFIMVQVIQMFVHLESMLPFGKISKTTAGAQHKASPIRCINTDPLTKNGCQNEPTRIQTPHGSIYQGRPCWAPFLEPQPFGSRACHLWGGGGGSVTAEQGRKANLVTRILWERSPT